MAKGRLTAGHVARSGPGRYCDGANLYLWVKSPGKKFWIFRYRLHGRSREAGLGPASGPGAVSLAEARQRAHHFRDQLFHGIDPIEARKAGKAAQLAQAALEKARAVTFDQCARCYIEAHESAWRNAKHRSQWVNTLRDYASPVFGSLPVEEITTEHLLAALKLLWLEKPETAFRVRQRIER